MIGTIDVKINAAHPNVPISPVFSWRGSASRVGISGAPHRFWEWSISAVSVVVVGPDGKTVDYPCTQVGNTWTTAIDGTETPGRTDNGISIIAKDTDGKAYVLGRGDLYVLDGETIAEPGDVSWSVRLVEGKPEEPKEGDAYFDGGALMVYSSGEWRQTMQPVSVPKKVSDLENDEGYLTDYDIKPAEGHPGWADHAVEAESAHVASLAGLANSVEWENVNGRPTKVSEIENDAGYITSKQVRPGGIEGCAEQAEYAMEATRAREADAVPWSGVTDHPTTLAGYGITDAATMDNVTAATSGKLTSADVVPKGSGTETIATIAGKDIKAPAGGGGIGYMILKPSDGGSASGAKIVLGDIYLYGYGYYSSTPNNLSEIPVRRTADNVEIGTYYCPGGSTFLIPVAADDPRNGTIVDFPVGSCLEGSTPITMPDGTTRRVADVRKGDMVLSIDPCTGEKTVDIVTETAHGHKDTRDVWTFDDGTETVTVGRHRFYNVDLGEFMYLEAWEIGERARTADGRTVRLVGHERVEGRTEYATIWTAHWNNYIAGGLLAGNRRSVTGAGI